MLKIANAAQGIGPTRSFILVQVWDQYLFSTLSYEFLKNDTLLDCRSGAKWTEKQDLLFTKIALTRREN